MDVLIVEDEDEARTTLSEALHHRAFRVRSAANGREALLALAALPRPCVVVVDLMMPVMDGGEFVRQLQLQGALHGVSLVALTAQPEQAQGLPFSSILAKPVQLEELVSVLRILCAAGSSDPAPRT
jgi:CheY-like chemotaxis protein